MSPSHSIGPSHWLSDISLGPKPPLAVLSEGESLCGAHGGYRNVIVIVDLSKRYLLPSAFPAKSPGRPGKTHGETPAHQLDADADRRLGRAVEVCGIR
jgi:hypothetical protein